MPKPPSPEAIRSAAAEKAIREAALGEGVGCRLYLPEPVADYPIGTWVFGTLRIVSGKPVVSFTGISNPPRQR